MLSIAPLYLVPEDTRRLKRAFGAASLPDPEQPHFDSAGGQGQDHPRGLPLNLAHAIVARLVHTGR
jgi:hypothetical protein